jgi:predicted transcriptional regulator
VIRSQYEIVSEMLYLALGEVHKTGLINSCKLSHKMCEKYITTLLETGLLEKKRNRFHTTKKGIQFIEIYQELERLFDKKVAVKTIQRQRIRKKRKLGFLFSLT